MSLVGIKLGPTVDVEQTVQTTAQAAVAVTAKVTARVEQMAQIRADAVVRCDCQAQLQVVAQLVAAARICDVVSEMWEDVDCVESLEEELDAELDVYADDDARDEVSQDCAGDLAGTEDPLPARAPHYEIKFVRRGTDWVCVPPANPFAGLRAARATDAEAKQILIGLNRQFEIYRKIANWLMQEAACVRRSPEDFVQRHVALTRAAFAKQFAVSGDKHAAAAVGQAVRLGCLVWPTGRLPLSCAFL